MPAMSPSKPPAALRAAAFAGLLGSASRIETSTPSACILISTAALGRCWKGNRRGAVGVTGWEWGEEKGPGTVDGKVWYHIEHFEVFFKS